MLGCDIQIKVIHYKGEKTPAVLINKEKINHICVRFHVFNELKFTLHILVLIWNSLMRCFFSSILVTSTLLDNAECLSRWSRIGPLREEDDREPDIARSSVDMTVAGMWINHNTQLVLVGERGGRLSGCDGSVDADAFTESGLSFLLGRFWNTGSY